MQEFVDGLIALGFVASMVFSLVDLYRARHEARALVVHWRAFAAYFALFGLGFAILLLSVNGPKPPGQALAGTAWFLAWLGFITLRLTRNLRAAGGTPPSFIDTPGVVDAVLVLTVAGAAAYYFGCELFHICS